jgi:hypothetical protein
VGDPSQTTRPPREWSSGSLARVQVFVSAAGAGWDGSSFVLECLSVFRWWFGWSSQSPSQRQRRMRRCVQGVLGSWKRSVCGAGGDRGGIGSKGLGGSRGLACGAGVARGARVAGPGGAGFSRRVGLRDGLESLGRVLARAAARAGGVAGAVSDAPRARLTAGRDQFRGADGWGRCLAVETSGADVVGAP